MIQQRIFTGADGLRLAADVAGSPAHPTVILMHGGGQTRHSWGGAMRALAAAGYFVINLDARGHGESAWCPQGKYSLQTRALDLLAVMKEVRGPCALVGASMGGATAMYTVCTATDLPVAALVLVDIVPNPSAAGVKRIHDFMRQHLDGFSTVDDAIAAVAAYNPGRKRPSDPQGMRKNLRAAANGRLKWHWDPNILTLDAGAESRLLNQALDAAADRHTVPTLLVRGLRSDVVSDDNVAQLRQRLPGLEICNVEHAGHMVAGDRNDIFNDGVIQFLRRHAPPHPEP